MGGLQSGADYASKYEAPNAMLHSGIRALASGGNLNEVVCNRIFACSYARCCVFI
jgi:hypothetical protein